MGQRRTSGRRWLLGCAVSLPIGAALVATTSCGLLQRPEGPQGDTTSRVGGSQSSTGASASTGTVVGAADGGSSGGASTACTNTAYVDPYAPGYTPSSSVTSAAASYVNNMSLADMTTLMAGVAPSCSSPDYNTFVTPGVSGMLQGMGFRDGPRGVDMTAGPSGEPCSNYSTCGANYSTTFPSASARGATFDVALEQEIGEAMGDETIASGNNVLGAPVINVLRHPAWGRSQETYGEDTYLLGRMGSAFVSGVQQYVPACAKHLAGYNIENGRTGPNPNVAQMDEQTFYEIYGRQFEMVIQDGGVACIMAAYNDLQIGSGGAVAPCTTDQELLTQMLRSTFGFQGWVVSDWWALPGGENACLSSGAEAPTAQAGVSAGLDMEMPWNLNYSQIAPLVGSNTLSQGQVMTSATRIVEQALRFDVAQPGTTGLKAPTSTYNASNNSLSDNPAHIALAYQAALESMVLLKNSNETLPIPSSARTVAVIAAPPAEVPFVLQDTDVSGGNVDFANDVRTGDLGSSRAYPDPSQSYSPYAGIMAAAPSGVNVISGTSAMDAASADFIVVVAGMTPEDEGEDYAIAAHGDRLSFSLDDKNVNVHGMSPVQDPLIESVAALGKPMVVVLEGGSVIDTSAWLDDVPALVMAWYPGQQGGRALGDLLFANKTSGGTSIGAQANFGGKLPVTWASWSDEPEFSAGPGQTTVMGYYVGYKYFDENGITPTFPFGAGLSYTTFSYANLQVPCATVTTGAVVDVQVDVTNAGNLDGDEITFLFVSYPDTQVRRPLKELKAFQRETIAAHATAHVTIPLRVEDLKYWNSTNHDWEWENGPVQIMVGGSSGSSTDWLVGSITVMN